MLRSFTTIVCLGLMLSGCARLAESRLNPVNWFGRSAPVVATTPDGELRPLVPVGEGLAVETRAVIDQIVEMQIEPTRSGAILRATGLAATQGFYNAELVLAGSENGDLTYDFRVAALKSGTTVDQWGAYLLHADPVTLALAAQFRRIIR